MVFSSVPIYLDPPNWNQQPTHQAAATGGGDHPQPPTPPPQQDGSAGMTTSSSAARPGSMAERARLAKVPQPEPGLPCPRCESKNTKFCYFNNYSLSQPRHFCKTCRRYWTRGGALRNVPVGGGCRRNKRSKSGGGSGTKSSGAGVEAGGTSAACASSLGAAAGSGKLLPPANNQLPPPQLPFTASLHQLPDYAAAAAAEAASIRLNLGGMLYPLDEVDHFQVGAYPSVGLEQWRLQYPFMSGLEPTVATSPSAALLPFDGVEAGVADRAPPVRCGLAAGQVQVKPSASVKTEDNLRKQVELSLPKQYLQGGIPGNVHYWIGGGGGDAETTGGSGGGGGGWADLSGFKPSSTSNNML